MTDHEPMTSIAAIYARVAEEFAPIPGNGDDIVEEAAKRILAADGEGALADPLPSPAELRMRDLKRTLNHLAKAGQNRVKHDAVRAQSLLDLGTDFDTVITVCGADTLTELGLGNGQGRKTTLGLFNADDAFLMGRESERNRRAVVAADDALQVVLARSIPDLRRFANYRQAVELGAAS